MYLSKEARGHFGQYYGNYFSVLYIFTKCSNLKGGSHCNLQAYDTMDIYSCCN